MGYQTNEEVLLSNINTNLEVNTEKTSFKTHWVTSNGDILTNYSSSDLLKDGLCKPSQLGAYGIPVSYDTMILAYKASKGAAVPLLFTSTDAMGNIVLAFANVVAGIDGTYSTTIAGWALEIVDLKVEINTTFSSLGAAVTDIFIITATVNVWIGE